MKSLSILFFVSLILFSCSPTPFSPGTITQESIKSAQSPQTEITQSPSPPAPDSTLTTIVRTPSATSTRTVTPTRKPTVTATRALDVLNTIIDSSYWQELGLSQEKMSEWQEYAKGEIELTGNDEAELKSFLSQWKRLTELAENSHIPPESTLDYKVNEFQSEQGDKKLVLYAIDGKAMDGESGSGLFLITHNSSGKEVSLWPAPKIENLNQQISMDGKKVEYHVPNGAVMLMADAVTLQWDAKNDERLMESLKDVYQSSANNIHSTYPRYRFPIPEVTVDFFAIEKLTYHQILLLETALELFQSNDIRSLAPFIFTGGKGYIIDLRMDDRFSGMASSSAGIAWLDPEKIVGNRYYLAEVIAHEGAHLRQDPTNDCNIALKYEIGKGAIPPELYGWSGAELMQALEDLEVGAYHVSVWVLSKLGIEIPEMLKWIIQEGRYNRSMILVNCP